MSLFQSPPKTPEELERSRPLDISPDEVAEYDEATWYEKAYRGDDVPQLTVRAVAMGSILGFFLAFTNLYIGLKTGWHLGVAITACILSFTVWSMMQKAGLAKTPMTILENNCMQSTASSAGYSTGSTLVSAIPALLMLSATPDNPAGQQQPVVILTLWTFFIAVLGVCLAIPMKRNMINQERLKFPSGLAAATTLQSLYASGSEAARKGKALLTSAAIGAVFPLLLDLNAIAKLDEKTGEVISRGPALPGHLKFDWFYWLAIDPATDKFRWYAWFPTIGADRTSGVGFAPSKWHLMMDANPVMIAAGALVGLRTTIYMVVAALILVFVLGPMGYDAAWTNPAGDVVYATSHPAKAWKEIGLWFGAPMMVAGGLLSFAFQWRTILNAFKGLAGSKDADAEDDRSDVEVPTNWFLIGAITSGVGVVAIAWYAFEVPVLLGALAVVLTFVLALVAARATGESDITPTGAMGKIMQLTYGVLIPQSATANLMTAGITSGAASASADLLNDLKSGYLLGANPRRQFIAQAMGIFTGTFATILGWYVLVPNATVLNGTADKPAAFPAPAAQAWKAVAEVFQNGIESMHPMHQNAIFWGLAIGAVLVVAEQLLPKLKKFLPSATGMGLGFILPFFYPLSMLVGAVIAFVWQKADDQSAKDYVVPVSAGIIAGISIVGVIVAALNNFVLG